MLLRFITTYEPVSPFYRDLVPRLADEGYQIEIVVTSAEYRPGRIPLEQSVGHPNVRIRRIPCLIGSVNSRWKKLWVQATYLIGCVLMTLFGRGADLNVFLTQPPFFVYWGRILRLIRRQRYCCVVMDLYPDVITASGMARAGSPVMRMLYWITRSALKGADRVIVIGRCMENLLVDDGVKRERIRMIPNWANEKEIHPVDLAANPLRKELALEGKLVCMYSGNIGVAHCFEEILATALELKEHSEIQFVFVGGGARRKQIEQFCEEHKPGNIRLLPYQPADRLSESLGLGDVHFVSLRESFTGIVVPSKAYGAFAAARPVIYLGEETGEIAKAILENDAGTVVSPGNPESICDFLRQSLADRELLSLQGQNAYKMSTSIYSRRTAINRYVEVLEEICGGAENRQTTTNENETIPTRN